MTWDLSRLPARTGSARRRGGIAGRNHLEHGWPVIVLIQWGPGGGPRNVLIRRQDGTEVVRPFRGLRRAPDGDVR
jgi:hypothetical protein